MNAPKVITFIVALIVAVVGVVLQIFEFTALNFLNPFAIWFVVAGFVILALGCCLKGL